MKFAEITSLRYRFRDGSGSSDKPSDNRIRQQQTERDMLGHWNPSDLR
jgi:hypothetical protein